MNEGASWSGHERNCVYLNLTDGTFADISAVSGLDFDDDGRACVVTDWDGDGDLDLWLKNRTGPQLRFLENQLPQKPAVFIRLVGAGKNTDAVGARVDVVVAERRIVRLVTAGDGYLSQASRRLCFGSLGEATMDAIHVVWPDGTKQTFPSPGGAGRYVIRQGDTEVTQESLPAVALQSPSATLESLGSGGTVLLREPLPLPPALTRVAYRRAEPDHPVLISFWAQWCVPCVTELSEWARDYATLREAGLTIHALGLDAPADQAKAALRFRESVEPQFAGKERFRQRPASDAMQESLRLLLRHLLGREGDVPLPISLLTDRRGFIQSIHLGGLTTDGLMEAVQRQEALSDEGAHLRSQFGGRWFFRSERQLNGLIGDFLKAGLREEAAFYQRFAQLRAETQPKTPR